MMILGIETAVEQVSVALGDHRGIRAEATSANERRHAESLVPMIRFVCEQAGIETVDIEGIAVDVGPGLFTGMRVGMATAEAMAWALAISIVPVCSLDIVAHAVPHSDSLVAACLDARRGEIYWSLYRTEADGSPPRRLTEPAVSSPEDMVGVFLERDQDIVCAGTGALRFRDIVEANVPRARLLGAAHAFPTARTLVTVASHRALREAWVSADELEPMYLRAPDAEINWATR